MRIYIYFKHDENGPKAMPLKRKEYKELEEQLEKKAQELGVEIKVKKIQGEGLLSVCKEIEYPDGWKTEAIIRTQY